MLEPAPERTPQDDTTEPGEINWTLLQILQGKPHPILPNPGPPDLPTAVAEQLMFAVVAHHLLDLANIPRGRGAWIDERNLDARTYLAIQRIQTLEERLSRIGAWHARETAPGGMTGNYCVACGDMWPCDTYRMAATGEERS